MDPLNKLQWKLNQNSYIFIQENVFESVVWRMAVIFSWIHCVNGGFPQGTIHGTIIFIQKIKDFQDELISFYWIGVALHKTGFVI